MEFAAGRQIVCTPFKLPNLPRVLVGVTRVTKTKGSLRLNLKALSSRHQLKRSLLGRPNPAHPWASQQGRLRMDDIFQPLMPLEDTPPKEVKILAALVATLNLPG